MTGKNRRFKRTNQDRSLPKRQAREENIIDGGKKAHDLKNNLDFI